MPAPVGYILDGFPRTVVQADALDEIAGDKPLDVVIDLYVAREVVIRRISARRVCRDCGTNYTATGTERQPWICEVCGGDVMQREDDHPDAINRRLDLYETQTAPLIEHYTEQERLVIVDGLGTPDEVFERITDCRGRGPQGALTWGFGRRRVWPPRPMLDLEWPSAGHRNRQCAGPCESRRRPRSYRPRPVGRPATTTSRAATLTAAPTRRQLAPHAGIGVAPPRR